MRAIIPVLLLALLSVGCAVKGQVPAPTAVRVAPPSPVVEGDLTPEEETIAVLLVRIETLENELNLCADDNITSAAIITNQDEHIKKLRRSQKWKTAREWIRIGAGFAVGYAVGDN